MTGTDGTVRGQGRTARELLAIIDPKMSLTAEQVAVVEAPPQPTLVVAGAGSGKTEALSLRLTYLLDHAVEFIGRDMSPDEVLTLTFTRKAAGEIAGRAARRLDQVFGRDPHRPLPAVSTYHAYAAGLVAEHGLRVGVDPDSTVLTDAALWQLAARVAETWEADLDFDGTVSSAASAVVALTAALADNGATPADLTRVLNETADAIDALPMGPKQRTASKAREVATRLRRKAALAPLIERYVEAKRAGSYIDFADQIAIGNRLAELPGVGERERATYPAVLLDEFQDTSPGQLALFHGVFGSAHPVMAVGDPHQAIYGFRGASEDALGAFVERFGGAGVRILPLLVSWRNSTEILRTANAVSENLRRAATLDVPVLRPRFEATGEEESPRDTPAVEATVFSDVESETRGLVERLVARRAALRAGGAKGPEAAILCRSRRMFTPVVAALRDAGVDHQVVGLGGLVDRPAAADLLALLEVAHDPTRGDSLMRLLTGERLALGIADIAAMHDWAQHGARERAETEPPGTVVTDDACLADVLEDLPPEGWVSRDGRSLGAEARTRLGSLTATVAAIRSHAYLPLPELLPFAARAFCLDIEARTAAASAGRDDGDLDLDALVEASRAFAAGAAHATLGAFLAWIEAARAEERGLDTPVGPVRRGAVQVMTVHAAKGMEWDVVAIPGLADGAFPHVTVSGGIAQPIYRDSGWLTDSRQLPWPLRLDRAVLPTWDISSARDLREVEDSVEAFREQAGGRVVDVDERRLFYVALTRARTDVILTGSWLGDGVRPRPVSVFLRELVAAGLVDDSGWAPPPATGGGDTGGGEEGIGEDGQDGVGAGDARGEPVVWPTLPSESDLRRQHLAEEVREAVARGTVPSDKYPYADEIEAMLAEAAVQGSGGRSGATGGARVALPSHLSTTDVVSLAGDRAAFALDTLRPVPTQPRRSAGRGDAFHAWVERHYRQPTLLDPEDWWGDDDPDEAEDVEGLSASFLRSEWANRRPEAVEAYVEVVVSGVMVRCRIDAVFPPGSGLERTTIVDWKTGARPSDEAGRRARDVQLSLYRAAWAARTGVPTEGIDAVFVYVATGDTVTPDRLLTGEEIGVLLGGGVEARPA